MANVHPVVALTLAVLVLGLILVVCWPKAGLLARWRRLHNLSGRMLREDALKHIHLGEVQGSSANVQSVAGTLQIGLNDAADLLEDMEQHNLLTCIEGELHLTRDGRDAALHIIRAHRLWESHLAEETGLEESEWHDRAEKQEHLLTADEADALAAQLGHPTHDPHGDPIPPVGGVLLGHGGKPLTTARLNEQVRIVHVEDEPAAIYARLAAQHLRAGMNVHVLEKTAQSVRFRADGREHVLTPIQANNIAVVPLTAAEAEEAAHEEYLCNLQPGQSAQVLGLTLACRGAERRRLLDLGFVPGTKVEVEMISPSGDPTAYLVRGTLVALRREQAGLVKVSKPGTT